MQQYCGNCGSKLEEGVKFCSNCGSPTIHGNEVNVNNNFTSNTTNTKNDHGTYKMITGIVMIILGSLLVLSGINDIEVTLFVYVIPGALGLVAGALNISSRNNHSLLKPSGIMLLVAGGVNFLGIINISLYFILSVVFGILNLVYVKKQ